MSAFQQLEIGIGLIGIGKMLSDGPWAVPAYQRAYAWEEKHVQDLLRDIDGAIVHDEPEYFLGSVVITGTKSAEGPEIVDGQQRLATIAILIAGVRDHFHQRNDGSRARDIEQTYLFDKDLRSQEINPKLKLNSVDHQFFEQTILQPPGMPGRKLEAAKNKLSHVRLKAAQKIVSEQIRIWATDDSERLFQLIDYLKSKSRVIRVTVPDDANAFTIFETLNDRGLALAITDLLKNFLFKQAAPKRIEEVKQRWVSMVATLEAVEDETVVAEFIRHYWSSRFGLTRDRSLYEEFKKAVTSAAKAVEFASELEIESRLYAAMLSPSHDFWARQTPTARDLMETLNDLGMIRLRPLVLSILRRFTSKKEVENALRLLVTVSVRTLIVGGGAGTIEVTYAEKAKSIRDGAITNTEGLFRALKAIIPTDTQFRDAFKIASISKSKIARYLLQALERKASNQDQPEWIPNQNSDDINLEHVMPQTPAGDWLGLDPETVRTYTKRIGNLCLMQSKSNSGSGNESFSAKKARYAKSTFKLTVAIKDEPAWNEKTIQKRQNELAELAIKTWPNKAK